MSRFLIPTGQFYGELSIGQTLTVVSLRIGLRSMTERVGMVITAQQIHRHSIYKVETAFDGCKHAILQNTNYSCDSYCLLDAYFLKTHSV